MTVTDPVAIHLKYIDQKEVKVIEEVVDANIGAEGTAIVVIGDCRIIRDIDVLDILLRNMDITKEIDSLGGRKAVQYTAKWTNE